MTTPRGRNRLERALFSVFGPPQLGDREEAAAAPPDPALLRCPRCEQPWDTHETVRTSSRGYLRCPTEH